MIMSPGTYLKKRRAVSGHSIATVSVLLAALPAARFPLTSRELEELRDRVIAAESDREHFTRPQAELLREVLHIDTLVYEELTLLHAASLAFPDGDHGLPVPQICRHCACSWFTACKTLEPRSGVRVSCAWSDLAPDLCTACERIELPARPIGTARPMIEGTPL